MGRRKKEEASYHRECIATAAEQLFSEKGMTATTMDDVAKAAKYSKATLYVFFRNKEEIVGMLVLKSMKLLQEQIATAIARCSDTKGRYQEICKKLTEYQEQYPLYFELTLSSINVDFDSPNTLPIERDIFEVGEQIMGEITGFLRKGIAEKTLREDIEVPQTVFVFWASLSGILAIADKKQHFIQKTMNITKQQFLEAGFETLFHSICKEEVSAWMK